MVRFILQNWMFYYFTVLLCYTTFNLLLFQLLEMLYAKCQGFLKEATIKKYFQNELMKIICGKLRFRWRYRKQATENSLKKNPILTFCVLLIFILSRTSGADPALLIRGGDLIQKFFFQILGNYSKESSFLQCQNFLNF